MNVADPSPRLASLATLLLGGDGVVDPPPNNPPTVRVTLPNPVPPNNPPMMLLVSKCLVGLSKAPNEASLKAAIIGEDGLYTLVSSCG